MLPAPVMAATVSDAPTAYVPVTLTAEASAKLPVTDKVPALTVVAPV